MEEDEEEEEEKKRKPPKRKKEKKERFTSVCGRKKGAEHAVRVTATASWRLRFDLNWTPQTSPTNKNATCGD